MVSYTFISKIMYKFDNKYKFESFIYFLHIKITKSYNCALFFKSHAFTLHHISISSQLSHPPITAIIAITIISFNLCIILLKCTLGSSRSLKNFFNNLFIIFFNKFKLFIVYFNTLKKSCVYPGV